MSVGEIKPQEKQASKAAPQLEWQSCADDAEWQARQSATTTDDPGQPARPSPWFKRPWPYTLLIMFLLLAGIGGWTWYQAKVGIAKIEGDLQATVQTDLWRAPKRAQQPTTPAAADELNVMYPLTSSVELLAMKGDVAIVRLTFQPASGETALRQTRLYQNTAGGWQRLAPSVALWGSPRSRQSRHFDFHYYAQDEEAVAAVAAGIDKLYEEIIINFQPLVAAPADQHSPIAIEVDPTQSYGAIASRTSPAAPLVVASPALYLAPVTISEEQLLAQSILLSLLNESRIQVIQSYHVPQRWQTMVAALYLWQLWQLDLPLAAWRKPLVSWVLSGLAEPQADFYRPQPDFAPQLCAIHQLWMSSPSAIHIPVSCRGPNWVGEAPASDASPFTLAQLLPIDPGPLQLSPPRAAYAGSEVVMTTLFDYAAARYGKGRLPLLLLSLDEHSRWETLTPAVFGVSAGDFEQGWRNDLVARYHLPCRVSGLLC